MKHEKEVDEMQGRTESELDALLESSEQISIHRLVASLKDEPIDLARRSRLNERVLQMAHRSERRRKLFRIWSPTLGLGAAAALTLVLIVPRQASVTVTNGAQEAAIATTLKDDSVAKDVEGAGVIDMDAEQESNAEAFTKNADRADDGQ